jgi:hypothetical protein
MAPDNQLTSRVALRDAGRWFTLAVVCVGIAGISALYLAVARIPDLETILSPDPQFGHRGLVVHVNQALTVWFSACIAGFFCLLPGVRSIRATPYAQLLAVAGVVAFSAALFARDATPMKSNYVPALDHWLFIAGIGMFGAAVGISLLDARLLPTAQASELPADARPGIRAAAIAYLTALATFGAAWSVLAAEPSSLEPLQYYERLFWGGGHVMQFANTLAMVSVWLLLLSRVLGRRALHPGLSALLFTLLLAPALAGPWLILRDPPSPPQHFTQMMRWGLFPVVSVFLVLLIASVWRSRNRLTKGALRGPAFVGFAVSAVMTVAGFILGAMIRGDNTLVPAHYHVSLGGVTAAFMAAILVLLPAFGAPLPGRKSRIWAAWQPVLYGVGMSIMAAGFAIAAAERKAYGTEQVVRTGKQWGGLLTMGLGGVVSAIGGIVFLVLLIVALRARRRMQRGQV